MSSWRGKAAIALVIGTLLPSLSAAQSQTPAPSGQSDRVSVVYVQPNNSSFQEVQELLRQHNALEKIKEILSPFQFPEQLTIETTECGVVNSYYQRKNFKPTVTLCYEFLNAHWNCFQTKIILSDSPRRMRLSDSFLGDFP